MSRLEAYSRLLGFAVLTSFGYLFYAIGLSKVPANVMVLNTFAWLLVFRCFSFQRPLKLRSPLTAFQPLVSIDAIFIALMNFVYWLVFWIAMEALAASNEQVTFAIVVLSLVTVAGPIALGLASPKDRAPFCCLVLMALSLISAIVLIRLDVPANQVFVWDGWVKFVPGSMTPLLLLLVAIFFEAVGDNRQQALKPKIANNPDPFYRLYGPEAFRRTALALSRDNLVKLLDEIERSNASRAHNAIVTRVRLLRNELAGLGAIENDLKRFKMDHRGALEQFMRIGSVASAPREDRTWAAKIVDQDVRDHIGEAAKDFMALVGIGLAIIAFFAVPMKPFETSFTGYIVVAVLLAALGLSGIVAKILCLNDLYAKNVHELAIAPVYAIRPLVLFGIVTVLIAGLTQFGWAMCPSSGPCYLVWQGQKLETWSGDLRLSLNMLPEWGRSYWIGSYLMGTVMAWATAVFVWIAIERTNGLFPKSS